MPSPDTLDFASLLAPIPGDIPVGPDLRATSGPSSLYYQVKDARSAARAAERQIESGTTDGPTPDWKAVVVAGTKALATGSKDLEIAAYLTEGLARVQGFAGIRDGFKLIRQLVETFWDGLYPTPDEEGLLTKVAPVSGLNGDDSEGTLLAPIRMIPITDSATHGRLTYANYLQALATSKILDPKVRDKKIEAGALTFDLFKSAIGETSNNWVKTLHDDLVQCIEEYMTMGKAFDAKCGASSPPTSAIIGLLNSVLGAVKDVARDKLAVSQQAAPEANEKADDNGKESSKEEGDSTPGEKIPTIRNREDALNAILRIADYFRRIEPHSMVPATLEQAVRWGRMPLTDLLTELIGDDDSRKALFKQVGLRTGEQPPEEEKKKKR